MREGRGLLWCRSLLSSTGTFLGRKTEKVDPNPPHRRAAQDDGVHV